MGQVSVVTQAINQWRQRQIGQVNENMNSVNLRQCFSQFDDQWSPKVLGRINDMAVKAVKIEGEFVWHHHEVEDELFLVVQGELIMRFRDRDVVVGESEFIIVPHGVEHLPVATAETWVVLFEPEATLNTGNVRNERTVEQLDEIS